MFLAGFLNRHRLSNKIVALKRKVWDNYLDCNAPTKRSKEKNVRGLSLPCFAYFWILLIFTRITKQLDLKMCSLHFYLVCTVINLYTRQTSPWYFTKFFTRKCPFVHLKFLQKYCFFCTNLLIVLIVQIYKKILH